MMPFIPLTEKNRREMLEFIGVSHLDDLLEEIPEAVRFRGTLDLPDPLSEYEVTRHLQSLAAMNADTDRMVCFLGGGAYDHFIPATVGHLISRPEFYTAYTPYQPEVSQGNLQAMYEFQSMVCELTGMDAANASVYDGASAVAEAALMMHGQMRRPKVLISRSVHPFYRRVAATYCHRSGLELEELPLREGCSDLSDLDSRCDELTAGLILQSPNFFGLVEPVKEASEIAHASNALLTVSTDPISLGLLEPPGRLGADIVTGEGQGLGNPLNLGGPYVGIFAVKQPLVRRMPGRIAGLTSDKEGRRGFVLTLQTREQHIRREKATSSICTNQQLCALASTVYLALMGRQGLPRVAELCLQKSHYLAERLCGIEGVEMYFPGAFFKEFAIRLPVPPERILRALSLEGFLGGVNLGRFDYGIHDGLLIAVTEKRSRDEMDRFVETLENALR